MAEQQDMTVEGSKASGVGQSSNGDRDQLDGLAMLKRRIGQM